MSLELPPSQKKEALTSLIKFIGGDDSFAVSVSDIDAMIPDDPSIYGDDDNFDLDKWRQVRGQKILELVESEQLQVEFIDREVGPMIIFEIIRFKERFLYYAISKYAVDAARNFYSDYANLTDEHIAIKLLDRYYQTIYSELFPEGDEHNEINIITDFADSTSGKLLMKLTNRSSMIKGYSGRGGEQRIEFFIYDVKAKRTVPIIFAETNV